jgi:hypothetical protein
MFEEHIGDKVGCKAVSFINHMAAATQASKNVILSIKHGLKTALVRKRTAFTTSKGIFELPAPKRMPAGAIKTLLEEKRVTMDK